jgi:hypothetical protein
MNSYVVKLCRYFILPYFLNVYITISIIGTALEYALGLVPEYLN